jgi:hypothetical protein
MSSPSLSLCSQDSFLSLILELGDDVSDCLNYVDSVSLSESGLSFV